MYLKSLELQGFKSFPDKIKLEFGKGLTAVVGPNGSGKSNIGDAIRWVLGEQSTKTLRGGKMEDVIFSGTQLRKSVGFAQVSLNIDNTQKRLLVDNDIVSVSRKLYRSGESEYLINGEQVRLKDVVELFMDTGLGRDGYSIIGQGKVAEIVSSKSNERREIFEEAAGISKFRYKKEEAERRLNLAQENILRLRDIILELEGRVEPLKVQSEKAAQFIVLSEEKKILEVSVWIKKLEDIKTSLEQFENKLLISTSEYENIDNDIEKIEIEIDLAYKNMQLSSVKVENLRGEILETERSNSQLFAVVAVYENEITHLNEAIKAINENQEKAKLSEEQTTTFIDEKTEILQQIEANELEISNQIILTTKEFENFISEADEFDKSYSEANNELNQLFIKKSESNFSITSSNTIIEQAQKQLEEAFSQQNEIHNSLENSNKEKSELQNSLCEIEEQLLEHTNKIQGYSKLLERKIGQLDTANSEFSSTDTKIRDLQQKVRLLTDLENSMEGFPHSVKEVIKAEKSGRIIGIKGSVAQLIQVESKYSLAIETALGASLQNIIVENEDTAKRCINLLKEQNAGRATFLPISSVKGMVLRENNIEMQEGYVAIASELVKYDGAFVGIINSLLGRIVIAENIDLATAISKKYSYKFRIVTLDGQVINAGGSFTGGSSSRSTGILTRKNELENAKQELNKLLATHTELKSRAIQLKIETDKLTFDVEGEKESFNLIKSDKIRFEAEIKHISIMLDQMESKSLEIEKAIITLDNQINTQEKLIETAKLEFEKACEEIALKESTITETQAKKDSFHQSREVFSEKLSSLKIEQIELKKDKEACLLAIDQLNASIIDSNSNSSMLDEEIKRNQIAISEKEAEIVEKRQELSKTNSDVLEINEQIKQEQVQHQLFERKANEQRNFQKIKGEEKETISREVARLQERKIAIQNDYDGIISELWEQHQLARSDAAKLAQEIPDMLISQKQLNEIKNKIRGLGSVNVAAIEEYKEVAQRYEFMSTQLNDVETSKKELENLIDDLTQNMKAIFSESFEKINSNFKAIFVELFNGGTAELSLSDPSDILESGIEIKVAPPGKVIKSLSLLSGGEQSFIAIAIYFAILKLKPSPFCVLDEIEAALDDVNVAKYAAYLRNFTKTTQFILITHRRGTMEEADVLYGVTMQEKGISKLLKMDTRDTLQLEK